MKDFIILLSIIIGGILIAVIAVCSLNYYEDHRAHKPPSLIATLPNGCQVYRIDAGCRYVYTTTCKGSTSTMENCGKIPCERIVETNEKH